MSLPKIWPALPALLFTLAACGGGNGNGGEFRPPEPDPGPGTVSTQAVFENVSLAVPLRLVQAPGDASRWFATERAGRVIVFDNDEANPNPRTFVDIRARVSTTGEGGLLGIAFHPDFAANREVFLSYTAPGAPLVSTISRFRSLDNGQTLSAASEEVILQVLQSRSNHNGGDILFGPDGFLYAAFGDGGGAGDPDGNGQNVSSLPGAILRIDVDVPGGGYDFVPSNPFVTANSQPCVQGFGDGISGCPEIFAWGFRNPWRMSFDRAAGDLWLGDVGQGEWEEVDRVEVGNNYGWNVREGAHCFEPPSGCSTANLVDPITEYDHGVGNSITGGYVYRGSALPDLVGYYVFGDFGSGRIWAVPADSPIGTAPEEIADTNFSIVSFAEDADGELYVIDFGNPGGIHRLVP
jgi:glucose/arabinose dehydrogenase